MSEKMYARLLRLYPSRFRKEYEEEALQLIRDRLCDETGLFKRARLWWDLVDGPLVGLPRAYQNSYAAAEAMLFSPNADGNSVLQSPGQGAAAARIDHRRWHPIAGRDCGIWICTEPANRLPAHSGSNGRMSAIESVA